jgi:origin recognition complex subunit 6
VVKRRRRTPQQQQQSKKSQEVAVQDVGDAVALEKWPALAIALHSYTVARMRGTEADADELVEVRGRAVDAVEQYCIQHAAALPSELQLVTAESLKKPVDFYLLEAEDCGWLDMDWYRNVPANVEGDEDELGNSDDDDDEDVEMEDEGHVTPRKRPAKTPLRRKEKHGGKAALAAEGLLEDDLGAAGLLPGLGTMFQPAIDWLSDENRADYARWKKGILKECAAIEARG